MRRRSFTLVELLVVTMIITILASTTLFALYGAMEQAKATRTRAQIAKINELIMEKWESYKTRKIPLLLPAAMDARLRAQVRLRVVRELMRMEMPERITDVTWTPTPIVIGSFPPLSVQPPALWRTYRRRAGLGRAVPAATSWPTESPTADTLDTSGTWTRQHQGAECLYLILSAIEDGDGTALDFFKSSEIGNLDGDAVPEILDAWGNTIAFLRWAPGYATLPGPDGQWGIAGTDDDSDGTVDNRYGAGGTVEVGAYLSDDQSELQSRDATAAPDFFDPLRVDPRWSNSDSRDDPFALIPLIYSGGPDGEKGIKSENSIEPFVAFAEPMQAGQANPAFSNNPYHQPHDLVQIGTAAEPTAEDNITNHLLEGE